MKKILPLCLIALASFTSCSSSNEEKIHSYYQEDLTSFVHADSQDVQKFARNNDDFLLFLYSDCGCGAYTDSVYQTFQEFIKETNLLIYAITSSDYKELPVSLSDTFPLYPSDALEESRLMPSLYYYKKGKLTYAQNYNDSFNTVEGIKSTIYQRVYEKGLTLLNVVSSYNHGGYAQFTIDYSSTTLLDAQLISGSPILYSWYSCTDCKDLKDLLYPFLQTYTETLYMFEVDHFRNASSKDTLWDSEEGFPVTYQFDSYRDGKVPVLVSYDNQGTKTSWAMFRNDVKVDGVITESFYEDLIGTSLSQEEEDNYHFDKVKDFLNERVAHE